MCGTAQSKSKSPPNKDRVGYAQVVGECQAIPLVVVELPKNPDTCMPQEEAILRQHKADLEKVLSHDFLCLLVKLSEKFILSDEEFNQLQSLQIKGDQVSLLADFLIEKAFSEKEMCCAIVKFLLQETVCARLGRTIAEELGML